MPQVFVVEVEESGGERRWARAEAAEDCTLAELHAWIAGALGLEVGAAYGFTRAGRRPGETCTFEGPGGEHLLAAEEVGLGGLALRAGRRMLHQTTVAPMRERIVRVLEVKEGELGEQRVRDGGRGERGRDPLARVDPVELLECVKEMAQRFEEEMEDTRKATGDDLDERLAVAREVAEFVAQDPVRILGFESLHGDMTLEWMADLHRELQERGRTADAFEALEAAEVVLGKTLVRGERMSLLVEAGRTQAAREDAGRWLAEAPEDAWALIHVGDLHEQLAETEQADALWRKAVELAGDDATTRAAALERLRFLVEQSGRREEALELGRLLEQASAESEREELGEHELTPTPRAERNDPCPCGSGKKFKRCCGSVEARAERTDAGIVDQLLLEIDQAGDAPEVQAALREHVGSFAGEEFQGWSLATLLPLLPADGLDEAFLQWRLLDLDVGEGRTAADLAERRRLKHLDQRERELLEQLKASAPCVWRIEKFLRPGPPVFAGLVDLLDPSADPVEVELGPEAEIGEVLVARLLAVDGVVAPGAGLVWLSSAVAEAFVPRVRRAFVELRAADPDTPWSVFRKRHACDLYRELIGTIHDELAKA